MFGKLNPDQIEELLKSQFIGRIGCHANGVTYVVPVSYAYDGIYVYGHTYEGMKVDMMRKNPMICFEADDTKNLANWLSVVAWGEFEELKDGKARDEAIQKLVGRVLPVITSETMHLSPQWPFPAEKTDDVTGIVYRIKLTEKTGRYEKSDEQNYFAS
jgi:uncharacterized protein